MRKVQKEDTVLILSGKDVGKKGRVLKVFPNKDQLIVEGVNMRKHHQRPTQSLPQGGIIEKEGPIHISNVKVVAPKTGIPTRIGVNVLNDGTKVRFAKHPDCNGEELT